MLANITSTNKYTRERLVQKFGSNIELLALGGAITRVVELASSDTDATRVLANCVLSDVALTQKILRLANTVFYRTASHTAVTTVSRAIFLLGFDTIKISALTMLLVDSLSNNKQAVNVRLELADALCASLVGREMARQSQHQGTEEASIAALFKNLGRLLVASHEHQLYNDIARLAEEEKISPMQASVQVLGCSYDFLSEAVLQEWNFPDAIIQAISPLPAGKAQPSKTTHEWMRQVATFSAEATKLIMHTHNPAASVGAQALLARFGSALHIDQKKLNELFHSVSQEIRHLVQTCNLSPNADINTIDLGTGFPKDVKPAGLPPALQAVTMAAQAPHGDARHPSGKPVNARDLLLAGIQDATQMMGSGKCRQEELTLLILETLYGSMGFRFATICLFDQESELFLSKLAIGEHYAQRQVRFVFSSASESNLFHLAMDNNADLVIEDATSPKIHGLLPPWHRNLLPDARSMIVLPLVANNCKLGVFYGDRIKSAPEGVPTDETGLIKTLKGQLLAALQLH